MSETHAGWYPDGQGALRYWDGQAWTEHTHQAEQPIAEPVQEVAVVNGHNQYQRMDQYGQAPPSGAIPLANQQQTYRPFANLSTNRSLLKLVLLSLITFGIYAVWIIASSGEDLNTIATRYDGKRNLNYWLVALVLSPITFGIVGIVWWHGTSNRIGNEQLRRGIRRGVSASDYWLWGVLGSLIIVGPFVFAHKWLSGMNELSADYNVNG